MPTLAIALVLVAAVLHAGWNVLLKTSGDTLWTAVRLQAIGTAILLPIGVAAWLVNGRPAVSAAAFWLAIASGVVEVILKNWKQPEGAVHLVTPPGGPRPARVEVLAEFLTKRLGKRTS